MKPKKFTQIQRIKRLENIASQMYYSLEVVKKQVDKLLEEKNKNK